MKQNYIVLSSGSTASSDPFLGPFSVRGTSPQVGAFMKVEVKQIEDRNLQSLTDRAGVVAVAPSVPMK